MGIELAVSILIGLVSLVCVSVIAGELAARLFLEASESRADRSDR